MPLKDLLFGFEGRVRRSHWWAVHLAILAVFATLFGTFAVLATAPEDGRETGAAIGAALGDLFLAALPFTVWIGLATGVKRLHDQGLSGWMLLMCLVPAVGGLVCLVLLALIDGQPHDNRYGPSPKYPGSLAAVFG